MNVEINWRHNVHIRPSIISIHNNKIISTERGNYLCKIDQITGKSLWEIRVNSSYGWISTFDNTIFYLEEWDKLKLIDFETGMLNQSFELNKGYPHLPLGYILIAGEFIITGSWRGYSNLRCFRRDLNLSLIWENKKKSLKTKENISYSLPICINNLIYLADNTNKILYIIDLKTGEDINSLKLPKNVGSLDLNYTIQFKNNKTYAYSNDGFVHSLSSDFKNWNIEIEHNKGIKTIRPKILEHQIIFQDFEDYICSYNIESKKLTWKFKSNHNSTGFLPALELDENLTMIGSSLGNLQILDKEGNVMQKLKNEKRINSDFYKIDDKIIFCNKSEIVSLIIK